MNDRVAVMGKRLITYLIGFWLLIIAGAAHASDAQHQANRCSALFMILTSIQNVESGLGQYFTQLGQLSGMMTSIYYEDDTGKVGTNGQMSDLKSKAMDKIGNDYPANYASLESEIKFCIGWVVSIGGVIQKNQDLMGTEAGAKSVFRKAPKPSSSFAYPFEDFATMRPLLRQAFDEWVAMGMVTPNSVKDALN